MRILVIGSGGREHALAWRLAKTADVFVIPGNPGIAQVATCLPAGDPLAAAQAVAADLAIVGPEAPLVEGVVDRFRAAGLSIFGPTAAAARLEGSKIFAKNFLQQSKIPTAGFIVAENESDARRALDRFGLPVVLKADGLMAGKGVVVARTRAEADAAIAALRGPLVVEECLTGEEVSFIVLADGRNVLPLAPTQDHKAVHDGDTGPNTGGMGAYCDPRILSQAETGRIMDTIIRPTVAATGFTGFLYAGLMMTSGGPKVLEFNVRMGDPETQPLMHRLDCDFAQVLMDAAHGRLANARLQWKPGPSVCVVMASGGYPGSYPTGIPIRGIEECEQAGATIFHAGTRMGPRGLETAGGRVLGVTHSGADLASAIDAAYTALKNVHFDGMHFRTDIGRKGLRRYNISVPGT
jgi:phosphoribosylamine---glycine ligase